MITDLEKLIAVLVDGGIEFIVIGGVAATIHGSARFTNDLDVVYRRSDENIVKLVQTLLPDEPYLRGAPPGLPFRWDFETVRRGLNFTLITRIGALDLLGEVTGGGSYEDLLPYSIEKTFFGHDFLCLNVEKLIVVKRAAGRPKDYETVAELQALRKETRT